jgi:AbrB family looped-hinge helix DNA binding protein
LTNRSTFAAISASSFDLCFAASCRRVTVDGSKSEQITTKYLTDVRRIAVDLLYFAVLPLVPGSTMETTATTKGQIVIPSSIRRKLGITAGTRIRVEIDERNAKIILTPITREYVHSLRGMFKGSGLVKELEAARGSDREREEKKIRNNGMK